MFPGYSTRCGGPMSEPEAELSEPDAELREAFHEEVTRRLDEMETVLLAIESGDPGYGMIDSLFRNVHTIKGTAGMFGLDDVTAVAHAAEDILAVVRETGMFPPSLVDPLLHATGIVRARVNGDDAPVAALLEELTASLAALSQPGSGDEGKGRSRPGRLREPRPGRCSPARRGSAWPDPRAAVSACHAGQDRSFARCHRRGPAGWTPADA